MKLLVKLAVVAAVITLAAIWFVRRDGRDESLTESETVGGMPVLLVGVDGLDWERLDRLAAEGRLPNLTRIRDEGASGVLHSNPPYVSPTIWTSIATGRLGENHGVAGFTVYGGGNAADVDLVGSGLIKCKTLWEILASAGKSSGVVGWLVTYPPVPVTSYTVTSKAVMAMSHPMGIVSSEDDSTNMSVMVHPPELWDEIVDLAVRPSDVPREDVVAHLGTTEYLDWDRVDGRMDMIAARLAGDRTTMSVAKRLMQDSPTDLTAIYVRGSDIISHFFWRYWEPESWTRGRLAPEMVETFSTVIDRYYEGVDAMVGEILATRDDDPLVIVCSDHGFAGHSGHPGFESAERGEIAFGINMHRDNGIILVYGPGVARGVTLEGARVVDVTPTILTAMGLPTARDMDGRPLTSAFERSFLERNPVTYVDTYETGARAASGAPVDSPIDEQEKELLRSLGYID